MNTGLETEERPTNFPAAGRPVPRAVWEAQPAQLAVTDKISVRNLQASVDAGVDVWGRAKTQRALITVTLSLARSFNSAAKTDVVDSSTVHYGKLSKDILACINDPYWISRFNPSPLGLVSAITHYIKVKTVPDNDLLASLEVDIFYPKGSMFGDGAGYSLGTFAAPEAAPTFYSQMYLRNVRVPCLIGVNSNERLQKQPVVVNLWIEPVDFDRSKDGPKLESAVVEVSKIHGQCAVRLTTQRPYPTLRLRHSNL